MKLDVSSIVKTTGASKDIDLNGSASEFGIQEDGFLFDSPFEFKGTIVNVGDILKLDGMLKTCYTVKCYRCLLDLSKDVAISMKETFVPVEKKTDEETYAYEGHTIEIGKVFKDNILLNLPMKQVCSEVCKGLCPQCGINLNSASCECLEDDVDPRMEGLKKFFEN